MRGLLALLSASTIIACSGSTPQAPTAPAPVPPPSPGPPPAAPVARMSVSIDSHGSSIAIQGLSVVKFDASGSSGTGLRFGLDFGDGQGADAAVATHVYGSGHTYKARAIVTDAQGRIDSVTTDVVVRSVEGAWNSGIYNAVAKRYEYRTLDIHTQDGRKITGVYTHPEGFTSPFVGDVEGDRGLNVRLTDGTISFSNAGGDGVSSDATEVTLTMQGGSANGQTLVFDRYGTVQSDSQRQSSSK